MIYLQIPFRLCWLLRDLQLRISCAYPVTQIQYVSGKTKCSKTFSRLPNWGASTVINRPLIPRSSACCTIRFVIFRSLFTYLKIIFSEQLSRLHLKDKYKHIQLEELNLARLGSIHDFVEWTRCKGWYLRMMWARYWKIKDYVFTICITPCFAAALVKFSSPSGWPSLPSAVADCKLCELSGISVHRLDILCRRACLSDVPIY